MDRFTPAASFRTGRPLARARPRPRAMSPSPMHRRSFTDSNTSMFITTDYDLFASSSPDSDLHPMFHMSPVHTHFHPPPPPDSQPVNVMTLCNAQKIQQRVAPRPPPLSPLLYSFPRPPSRLHAHMTKTVDCQKPLPGISFNNRPKPVKEEDETPPAGVLPLSLSNSLLSATTLNKKKGSRKSSSAEGDTTTPPLSPFRSRGSSPIPIPRHSPRQSDPGVYDVDPRSPSPPCASTESFYATQQRPDHDTEEQLIFSAATGTPLPSSSAADSLPLFHVQPQHPRTMIPVELESIPSPPRIGNFLYPDSTSDRDARSPPRHEIEVGRLGPYHIPYYRTTTAAENVDDESTTMQPQHYHPLDTGGLLSNSISPPGLSPASISLADLDPFRFSHYLSESPSVPSVVPSPSPSAGIIPHLAEFDNDNDDAGPGRGGGGGGNAAKAAAAADSPSSVDATVGSVQSGAAFMLLKRLSVPGRKKQIRSSSWMI